MTTEQMIEEAVNRFEKKFGMYYQPHGDAFNEASAFFSNELRLIATKSAEEEREYATKNVTRIIMEWGKEYKISMQLQTYLLGAMLSLYKSKDTNE